MHKSIVAVILVVFCTFGCREVNYYYLYADDGVSAGSGGAAVLSPPETHGGVDAGGLSGAPSAPIRLETDAERAFAALSCSVTGVHEFGPSFDVDNLVGSPFGYLVVWRSEWGTDVMVQAFDVNGEPADIPAILTDSSAGAWPVIGSHHGYVAAVNPGLSDTRIVRFDGNGSVIASMPMIYSMPYWYDLCDGDPQELITWGWVTEDAVTLRRDHFLSIARIRPDAGTHGIAEYITYDLDSGTDVSPQGIAENGDTIAVAMNESCMDSENVIRTRDMYVILYDGSRFRSVVYHTHMDTDSTAYLSEIAPFADGFALIWGINTGGLGGTRRYVTTVGSDGGLGPTHEISIDPFPCARMAPGGVIAATHDDVTLRGTFRRFTIRGELLEELELFEGDTYYLGGPRVTMADERHYAASWVESEGNSLKTAFIICE